MALLLVELAILSCHGGQAAGVGREKGMGGGLAEGARRGCGRREKGRGEKGRGWG
jgi:hypothetical protein